jgi:cytochrome P450
LRLIAAERRRTPREDVLSMFMAFDITRERNRHPSFGMGTYYCLGAALARMETDECLRILLDRCPNLRPAYETPDWLPTAPIGHRLGSLPVTF